MEKNERKGNDFDIGFEDLATSWKRAAVGLFDSSRIEKMRANFKKAGSSFWEEDVRGIVVATNGIKDLFNSAKQFGKNVKDGATELFQLIKSGQWKEIGSIWGEVYKNDPAAWLAGSIAAAGVAIVGFMGAKATVAALGSIPLVASGLTRLGALKAWIGGGASAMLKNPWFAAISVGGFGGWLQAFTVAAPKIYNFDWQISDEAYQKAMDDAVNNLYEPAGEFLGRASGAFLAGRLTGSKPPRAQIDVTALAIMHELGDDEIKEEIEDAATEFMHAGLQTFMGIGITYLYTSSRHFISSAYRKMPSSFRSFFKNIKAFGKDKSGKAPSMDEVISTWGNKGNNGWSIKKEIDLEGKIESVEDEKLKNFLTGFFDNFWDSFSECVSYSSAFKGAY